MSTASCVHSPASRTALTPDDFGVKIYSMGINWVSESTLHANEINDYGKELSDLLQVLDYGKIEKQIASELHKHESNRFGVNLPSYFKIVEQADDDEFRIDGSPIVVYDSDEEKQYVFRIRLDLCEEKRFHKISLVDLNGTDGCLRITGTSNSIIESIKTIEYIEKSVLTGFYDCFLENETINQYYNEIGKGLIENPEKAFTAITEFKEDAVSEFFQPILNRATLRLHRFVGPDYEERLLNYLKILFLDNDGSLDDYINRFIKSRNNGTIRVESLEYMVNLKDDASSMFFVAPYGMGEKIKKNFLDK